MFEDPAVRRVEVGFVGAPPAERVRVAPGVSDVEIDGSVLRCLVCGSFQPFLEALRGYEVISLQSYPVPEPGGEQQTAARITGTAPITATPEET
ncbi:hypothetical protein [Nonomuraea sp. SYSU D8015]|uniref:hypothetical protein n=1 Tax=Nonomuraea sp. SYSU D8015 TaxID=2593644 RepID=UPI0016608849|nr:hypothetical protein [Nonomuraea sp. SYSU D8015]